MGAEERNEEEEKEEEEESSDEGVGLDIVRLPWPDDDDESD